MLTTWTVVQNNVTASKVRGWCAGLAVNAVWYLPFVVPRYTFSAPDLIYRDIWYPRMVFLQFKSSLYNMLSDINNTYYTQFLPLIYKTCHRGPLFVVYCCSLILFMWPTTFRMYSLHRGKEVRLSLYQWRNLGHQFTKGTPPYGYRNPPTTVCGL